jgi:hypothetical protein
MSKLVILMLCNVMSLVCTTQNTFRLQFIDDYPIKIDGGCNFFTYANIKLANEKFIYVVSGNRTGFFKVNGR